VPALQFGAPKADLSACQLSPFNSFIRNGNALSFGYARKKIM
jgi:hypothetical protein